VRTTPGPKENEDKRGDAKGKRTKKPGKGGEGKYYRENNGFPPGLYEKGGGGGSEGGGGGGGGGEWGGGRGVGQAVMDIVDGIWQRELNVPMK